MLSTRNSKACLSVGMGSLHIWKQTISFILVLEHMLPSRICRTVEQLESYITQEQDNILIHNLQ